ncbi:2-keto-4-pentenoate hydratase [Aquibaculum arenosum]|uniref:Hydratase n=1 Tax=Aquibaculum arenosum TaxID=3032591 RepID=A0ABT5YSH9_9PROT|nr:fumarylacetoacetate hydrolase family protein [Fodinicurvata sp. CAU 1616]MDF2097179.1 hydratase [Fodinicurvata sp. CAU 1616]
MQASEHDTLAQQVLALRGTGDQVTPFTESQPGLDITEAYGVGARLRVLREGAGDSVVGRKIGFTNRSIWPEFGINQPIWGYVYASTLQDLAEVQEGFSLSGLPEPKIEPEIILGLGRAPEPGMDESDLFACLDWVSHGFEIVQSIFPGWRFAAPDTIAGGGLHGALLVGPKRKPGSEVGLEALHAFDIAIQRNGEPMDRGKATNVLGGPLTALRHLVELLPRDPYNPPLAAGEVVTTGTLTRAFDAAPGETWETSLEGIDLPGARLRFT